MSAIPFGSGINLSKSQLLNAAVHGASSAPSSPVAGQIYFDTTTLHFGVWTGSAWEYTGAAVTNGVTKAANASAASVLQVSGGADKTLADFTSAGGIVKVSAAGVVSLAVAGTDYVTAGSTNTLTNKSFDANGTGNAITNIETADFAAGTIDTDGALTANSDVKLATQKAVKTAIAAAVSGVAKPMGGIDCSANPNYPAANVGEFYRVTVAGLIGGVSGIAVTVGDELHCYVTAAAGNHATVGANWTIVQNNVDQATTSVLGLVTLATNAEALAQAVTNKAVTPVALVGYTQKKIATIGDGATLNIVVTDNLPIDKQSEVRDATTNTKIYVDTVYAANNTTFKFDVAPAINAYKVTIIG